MDNLHAVRRFDDLPTHEQERYRIAGQQMVRLAQSYAVPILYAPPPRIKGHINGATGTVVQLGSGFYIVTASHVLEGYENRLSSGEQQLNWQVGHLPPFDPRARVAFRDRAKDTLLLRLLEDEARRIGSCIMSSTEWPPPPPEAGQLVLVSGYPKVLREIGPYTVGAGPLSAMFRVTTTGDGYFYCQIERNNLVSFNEGSPLPDASMDMGGLSGGPALLVAKMTYPLVGIISEYHHGLELLRIATLESATIRETS
jgi:hypothetical protein